MGRASAYAELCLGGGDLLIQAVHNMTEDAGGLKLQELSLNTFLRACADDGLFQCQPPKSGASTSSSSNYAVTAVGGRRRLMMTA